MKSKTKYHRIIFLLVLFCILFIGSLFFIHSYIKKRIINELVELVDQRSKGNYKLDIEDIDIQYLSSSINLNKISFKPTNKDDHSFNSIDFKADRIRFTDLNLFTFWSSKSLRIDKILFKNPQIFISPKQINSKPINHSFEKNKQNSDSQIQSISINSIYVENILMQIIGARTELNQSLSEAQFKLDIQNINYKIHDTLLSPEFGFSKFNVQLNHFQFPIKSDLYTLKSNSISFNYLDSLLIIDSLNLDPIYEPEEFGDKAGRQSTYTSIHIPKIICSGFNPLHLMNENAKLHLKELHLNDGIIEAYRDNNIKIIPKTCLTLQEIIRNIPIQLSIESLFVKNASAHFRVIAPKQSKPGELFLNKMNIAIHDFKSDYPNDNSLVLIRLNMDAQIMNTGKLNMEFIFPYGKNNKTFDCNGSLGNMPFSAFNGLVRNTLNIQFTQGNIDGVSFHFHAGEKVARGKMTFNYHNLNVDNLKGHKKESIMHKKLSSFFLNKLVVQVRNPDQSGFLRTSNISATRDTSRYFLHYASQAIISGISQALLGEKKINLGKNIQSRRK